MSGRVKLQEVEWDSEECIKETIDQDQDIVCDLTILIMSRIAIDITSVAPFITTICWRCNSTTPIIYKTFKVS